MKKFLLICFFYFDLKSTINFKNSIFPFLIKNKIKIPIIIIGIGLIFNYKKKILEILNSIDDSIKDS